MGTKGFKAYLQGVTREFQVDFLGIQETMRKDFSDAFFRRIDPLNQFT